MMCWKFQLDILNACGVIIVSINLYKIIHYLVHRNVLYCILYIPKHVNTVFTLVYMHDYRPYVHIILYIYTHIALMEYH